MNIELPEKPVVIDYTNWRGERVERVVVPIRLWYGRTFHHQNEQWFVRAWDLKKLEARDFAVQHIHRWSPPQ